LPDAGLATAGVNSLTASRCASRKGAHLAFGDIAAGWSLLINLDVADVIDEVVGGRRSDAEASVGTYVSMARWAGWWPRLKKAFAEWWAATSADRFTRIGAKVLDNRKFWDAMHSVDAMPFRTNYARIAAGMITKFDLDVSSVALDMTNFATYIEATNGRAPIAERGKPKQNTPTTPGRTGHGRHPGRWHPTGLVCLPREPARRHPVADPDRAPHPAVRPPRRRCR
jgi:hypothetical protein